MAGNYDETNRGVLFKNDRKDNDKHPDYKGKGNFQGTDFEMAAWIRTGKSGQKFMSFAFSQPYKREDRSESSRDAARDEPEDDLAF